jgi:hypothetical protein
MLTPQNILYWVDCGTQFVNVQGTASRAPFVKGFWELSMASFGEEDV